MTSNEVSPLARLVIWASTKAQEAAVEPVKERVEGTPCETVSAPQVPSWLAQTVVSLYEEQADQAERLQRSEQSLAEVKARYRTAVKRAERAEGEEMRLKAVLQSLGWSYGDIQNLLEGAA